MVHHIKDTADWAPFRIPGFTARDTGITTGTKGVAGIQVVKFDAGDPPVSSHDADIHFTFVMDGTMILSAEGRDDRDLQPGDAFVIPPGMMAQYCKCSPDLELLEVALKGGFATQIKP